MLFTGFEEALSDLLSGTDLGQISDRSRTDLGQTDDLMMILPAGITRIRFRRQIYRIPSGYSRIDGLMMGTSQYYRFGGLGGTCRARSHGDSML